MNARRRERFLGLLTIAFLVCSIAVLSRPPALADGKVMPPRNYKGSLEESAQEAIIIFNGGKQPGEATESVILKISVQADQELDHFGWVVPFPMEPSVHREDPKLFKELFDYVEARRVSRRGPRSPLAQGNKTEAAPEKKSVEVLSRKIVGSYDVAVVKENEPGALNEWLEKEGFQSLGKETEDVIGFYREKSYVFACMKVSDVALTAGRSADLHPLRFTFKTGGRDGIYFPMKMTGLQSAPFSVNLYVFYSAWLNDKLNKFGYVHRGFRLRHRDWDTEYCQPNAGKSYSAPQHDPYLQKVWHTIPTVTKLFQKLHPGQRYYLTNLQAMRLNPQDVREWVDDLWLFPHYTDTSFAPYDVREGGPAATAWPGIPAVSVSKESSGDEQPQEAGASTVAKVLPILLLVGIVAAVAIWVLARGRRQI